MKKTKDKLVEEFSKNIDRNEMIHNSDRNVWHSSTFLIIIDFISACFIFSGTLRRVISILLKLILILKQEFNKHINKKYEADKC